MVMEVKDGSLIVVWFSCGAASAVAAKKTIELYGDRCRIIVANNPVAEEDSDNLRFKDDVSKWIGQDIVSVDHKDYPNHSIVEIFDKRGYMGGVGGAPCTMILKREARYQFELAHNIDFHVLGFTADEKGRHERFTKVERANTIPVLIDLGITKGRCFEILDEAGIEIPRIYLLGYPNANCIGCVKANSPTYWNHVRKVHPEVFDERAEQSRRIGAKLVRVNGKRIYLDELDPKTVGGKMRSLECGIFCYNGKK